MAKGSSEILKPAQNDEFKRKILELWNPRPLAPLNPLTLDPFNDLEVTK